ncbi:MAG: LysM peptidoglycan-binding domain-containing protein [Clostridiales bacterium]|nr:LysM peptidoglycan-binding domain-containing protein [Clostridiales bacterium]
MYCINYIVKKGDTLYSISRRYRVELEAILSANPLINVYNLQEGDVICIPVSIPQNNYTHFTTYLVEEEDTLGMILDKFSINLADLMELNDLNSIYIEPGTTLQVPIIDYGEDEITL